MGSEVIMLDTALAVINDPDAFISGDVIEAFQYINDTGNVHLLSEQQQGVLNYYIEAGIVDSQPIDWRPSYYV